MYRLAPGEDNPLFFHFATLIQVILLVHYLKLNEEEEKQFEAEIGKIDTKEAERMMDITTSWERKGRAEGQADLLIRLLHKKFNNVPPEIENQVKALSAEKLQQLAEAIFDLKSIEDIKAFL